MGFGYENDHCAIANNNLKSRLHAKFSYICCIFSHEASTSGHCYRELKLNSKVVLLANSEACDVLKFTTKHGVLV